jgi:anaerobic sulfite reductase subunit B
MAPLALPETASAVEVTAPRPFRVVKRSRETQDTWSLELEPVAGEPLRPAAGQFTMLYAFGTGEVPISVSGQADGRLVHTVRAVGAVTERICALSNGDILGVRGPFGNGWPVDEAREADVVVAAGGIGLAPLRPALHAILGRRTEYGDLTLLYGSRTPSDLLYRRELERWRGRLDVDVEVTVDTGDLDWRGRVGVVTQLVGRARFDPRSAVVLICGPEIMMRLTALAFLQRGVPPECIYISMERNMRCGVGHCGHCQLGPTLICRDGPVYRYDEIERLMKVREL